MSNVATQIDRMSDVRIKSEFKVGASSDIFRRNAKKTMTPEQVKQVMIKTREYRFITPGQLSMRKKNFTKNLLEKLQVGSLKKVSKFEGKILFTNKF